MVFSLPTDYRELDWSTVAQGHVTLTRSNGDRVQLTKTSAPGADAVGSFVGTYHCAHLPSTLTIALSGAEATAVIRGNFAYGETWTVRALTKDICILTDASGPWPRQLTCRLTGADGVLLVNGGRAKRMRFEQVRQTAAEAAA